MYMFHIMHLLSSPTRVMHIAGFTTVKHIWSDSQLRNNYVVITLLLL